MTRGLEKRCTSSPISSVPSLIPPRSKCPVGSHSRVLATDRLNRPCGMSAPQATPMACLGHSRFGDIATAKQFKHIRPATLELRIPCEQLFNFRPSRLLLHLYSSFKRDGAGPTFGRLIIFLGGRMATHECDSIHPSTEC